MGASARGATSGFGFSGQPVRQEAMSESSQVGLAHATVVTTLVVASFAPRTRGPTIGRQFKRR